MPDILRAKVLLSLSRPVRVYEYEIESENQAILLKTIRFRKAGTTSSSQEGPGNLVD
jgi:hypothetical protein